MQVGWEVGGGGWNVCPDGNSLTFLVCVLTLGYCVQAIQCYLHLQTERRDLRRLWQFRVDNRTQKVLVSFFLVRGMIRAWCVAGLHLLTVLDMCNQASWWLQRG